jgi:Flp pilus assembly secretin CpaC
MSGRVKTAARGAVLTLLLFAPVLAAPQAPEQVVVSVKIIEFQATKGVETGLSAYFSRLPRALPFGEVDQNDEGVGTVDLTFPTSTAAGITVFLDRISIGDAELEVVLQALVDENRAFILSRPHAMVMVGDRQPTVIRTNNRIPYESTRVVGSTTIQITEFQDTGVTLSLRAPEVIDDDGDWETEDDTYIRLDVYATVKEEGQRIVIALDDQLATTGDQFTEAENAISVPEFISRSVTTHVWVRQGQVLMLGGLYRNSESKSIASVPVLNQVEDAAQRAIGGLLSGDLAGNPLTGTIGNRDTEESRRELVFLIKAETWRPGFAITDDLGFIEQEANKRRSPTDVILEVTQDIAGLFTGRDRDEKSASDEESENDEEPTDEAEQP